MKKLLTWSATVLLCLAPSIASAAVPFGCYQAWMVPQERKYAPQGWFLGGAVGLNQVFRWNASPEVNYTGSDIPTDLTNMSITPQSGLQLGFLWGYRYKGFRFESDLTLRRNQLSSISKIPKVGEPDTTAAGFPGTITPLRLTDEGVLQNMAFFLNFFYDAYFEKRCLYPFVGIGVGIYVAQLTADIFEVKDPTTGLKDPDMLGPDINEIFFNFGFQFTLGLGWVFSDHWEADIAYKYFLGASDTFSFNKSNFNIDDASNVEVEYNFQYSANSIVLEFRWS